MYDIYKGGIDDIDYIFWNEVQLTKRAVVSVVIWKF